jgi:hypothetical protein
MTGPADHIPAHLADLDQRIADINARLDRNTTSLIRGSVVFMCLTLTCVAVELTARPPVHRWELVAWMLIAALLAAGGFYSQRMIRSLREEIRYLRSQPKGLR